VTAGSVAHTAGGRYIHVEDAAAVLAFPLGQQGAAAALALLAGQGA